MDAVILRQSEQLQRKLSIRPGDWVGWGFGNDVRTEEADELGGDRTGKGRAVLLYMDEETQMPDLRMPTVQRHRSM